MGTQLIFLGAPGSGKGTQAGYLANRYGFKHLSTGDLLRQEMQKRTELGKRVNDRVNAGQLVDDSTVLELLKANCQLDRFQYIFDGLPRNIDQAIMLDKELLKSVEWKALFFNIDSSLLLKRLTNRRTCRECSAIYNILLMPTRVKGVCDKCGEEALYQRDDDAAEVIRGRLKVYNRLITPVLDFYREKEKERLVELDAKLAPDDVFNNLVKIVA